MQTPKSQTYIKKLVQKDILNYIVVSRILNYAMIFLQKCLQSSLGYKGIYAD